MFGTRKVSPSPRPKPLNIYGGKNLLFFTYLSTKLQYDVFKKFYVWTLIDCASKLAKQNYTLKNKSGGKIKKNAVV